MKFIYPYKSYIVGFVLFATVSILGFYTLFIAGTFSLPLSILYILISFILGFWYYIWYKTYKNTYVMFHDNCVKLFQNNDELIFNYENVFKVLEIKRRYFVRIQKQIYIITYSGKSYCITNEINSFDQLKHHLNKLFDDKYIIRKELLSPKIAIHEII